MPRQLVLGGEQPLQYAAPHVSERPLIIGLPRVNKERPYSAGIDEGVSRLFNGKGGDPRVGQQDDLGHGRTIQTDGIALKDYGWLLKAAGEPSDQDLCTDTELYDQGGVAESGRSQPRGRRP